MKRVTVTLHEPLYRQLKMRADQENMPLSELVRHYLDQALEAELQEKLEAQWAGLQAFQEAGRKISQGWDPNLSSQIDEVLYGENGAWRRQQDEDDE